MESKESMLTTAFRVGLGAAAVAAGTATQWFWQLVERGQAVRPDDPGVAAALDRTVTIAIPTAIGAAVGSALDAGLRAAERTGHVAAETADELGRLVATVIERAGIPDDARLETLTRRLNDAAATLDRIVAEERHRPSPTRPREPPETP